MPDISELNGTAIDNVREFDGLTVTGVPTPAAAYSVRLLNIAVGISLYTGPAMRVRRVTGVGNTGNDDEADVAFDTSLATPTISLDSPVSNFSAGGSNATNLGQFLNATGYTDADSLTVVADGFCDEWKDQSGNGNHASQATPANQPQIFDSASPTDLITINGKTAIHTPNADQDLECSGTNALSQVYTVNAVGQGGHPYAYNGGASRIFMTSSTVRFKAGTEIQVSGINASGNQTTVFCVADGTNSTIHAKNSGAQVNTTGDAGTQGIVFDSTFQIGNRSSFVNGGYTQELVFWNSDQSSNRTGIETNINGFFGIY